MSASAEHIVFEPIQFAAVTRNGFSDVSILTKGEASGHGMIVDEKTIEEFMQLTLGKTIPAFLTHAGAIGADGQAGDRLGSEIGMFSGFYRDGDRVRARNFQFLESFVQAEPRIHSTLVEMAQKFADKLGISPVLAHFKAWVLGDGSEVPAKNGARPDNSSFALPSMRIGSIKSCDFVQRPAANLGLFEAKVDANSDNNPNMTAETILLSAHTTALSAKQAEIVALQTQHKDAIAALEAKHATEKTALEAKANEAVAQAALAKSEKTSTEAALAVKTKEAEDAAKYDMRKAGAPALEIALNAHRAPLPEPLGSDTERWGQYAALCTAEKNERGEVVRHIETPTAKAFKEKYIARK